MLGTMLACITSHSGGSDARSITYYCRGAWMRMVDVGHVQEQLDELVARGVLYRHADRYNVVDHLEVKKDGHKKE